MDLSRELVDAAAPVVAAAMPPLIAATPEAWTVPLGRSHLFDPFRNQDHVQPGDPNVLFASLYPVVDDLRPVVPALLEGHPDLALDEADASALATVLANERQVRLGEIVPVTTFSLEFTAASDASVPEPQPAIAGSRGDPLPSFYQLVDALSLALLRHSAITPLLTGRGRGSEADLLAAHCSAHLALCVASAVTVGHAVPGFGGDIDLVRLLSWHGHSSAWQILARAGAPAGYAEAIRARLREGPTADADISGGLEVRNHRFCLVEGFLEALWRCGPDGGYQAVRRLLPRGAPDFSGNGLVALAGGVPTVRTGVGRGTVQVSLRTRQQPEPPGSVESEWEEVVDLSWTAAEGCAVLLGGVGKNPFHAHGSPSFVRLETPPRPGDYRIRVCASGRDRPAHHQRYRLTVWPEPAGPEIVHRAGDALGRELRGEPAVETVRPPVTGDWISWDEPATLTVVTGAPSWETVARASGAQPVRLPADTVEEPMTVAGATMVLTIEGVTLVWEFNGFRCADPDALRVLAGGGRAASYYWNINTLNRLSFAAEGQFLGGFEAGLEEPPTHPELTEVLHGLEFTGSSSARHRDALRALERFTGFGVSLRDYEQILTTGIGFLSSPP